MFFIDWMVSSNSRTCLIESESIRFRIFAKHDKLFHCCSLTTFLMFLALSVMTQFTLSAISHMTAIPFTFQMKNVIFKNPVLSNVVASDRKSMDGLDVLKSVVSEQ